MKGGQNALILFLKGSDIMSKIMRIFGNFEQFGKWSEPDPGFDGHILVNDDGSFIGYQNELYGTVKGLEYLNNELNNIRFVIGHIGKSRSGAEGIAFLKLSRESRQAPLMYVVPDLTKGAGNWAVLPSYFQTFEPEGGAKVSVETQELEDDSEIADKIHKLHDSIRKDRNYINDELIKLSGACLEALKT